MDTSKPDRRIQRTKRLLQDALLELIVEQRYDSITVQDILDRADVGRSTFYAHFRDKDDLLVGGMPEQVFHLHLQPPNDDNSRFTSYLDILYHGQEHHKLFKALIGSEGIEVIKREISISLKEGINRRLKTHLADSAQREIVATFLTGAVMACFVWWHDNDMPCAPEELDKTMQQLISNGLGTFTS